MSGYQWIIGGAIAGWLCYFLIKTLVKILTKPNEECPTLFEQLEEKINESLDQTRWDVTVSLTENPKTFQKKVLYLLEVIEDVLKHHQRHRPLIGYKLVVKIGTHTYDYSYYELFNAAQLVMHLIEIGLNDVFKQKTIDITLIE